MEQWGAITWDFQQLTMKFRRGNKFVLFHGLTQDSVRELRAQKLNLENDDIVQVSMIMVQQNDTESQGSIHSLENGEEVTQFPHVTELLQTYADIFEEPKLLPPFRENHNHKIPLLEGSNPVNQRHYRNALHQKNKMDKMVRELLQAGTIQSSSSSYASPVVLVKKKDGRRFCVWITEV